MSQIIGNHIVADPFATTHIKRPAHRTSLQTTLPLLVSGIKFPVAQPTSAAAPTSTPTADAALDEFVAAVKALTTHEYAAHLGLASGLHTFLRIMYSSKEYKDLSLKNPDWLYDVLWYLSLLCFDEKYANPYDEAMATIVVILRNYTMPLKPATLEPVVRNAKKCFWLWKVLEAPTL